LLAEIIESQKTDRLATELLGKLDKRGRDHVTKQVTKQHVTGHVTEEETTTEDWAVSAGALTFEGRVYVPDSDELRPKVITSTMIIPNQSSQTYEARRQYAYRACEPAVEGVTIDFVTDLPESTASTYTSILVVVKAAD
jgi:NADPH-dependent ferric siderophore reductase